MSVATTRVVSARATTLVLATPAIRNEPRPRNRNAAKGTKAIAKGSSDCRAARSGIEQSEPLLSRRSTPKQSPLGAALRHSVVYDKHCPTDNIWNDDRQARANVFHAHPQG